MYVFTHTEYSKLKKKRTVLSPGSILGATVAMGIGDLGGRCDKSSCLQSKMTGKAPNTLPNQKTLPQGYRPVLSLFLPISSWIACLSSGDLTTLCGLLNLAERLGKPEESLRSQQVSDYYG